jgi:hypothetical protein
MPFLKGDNRPQLKRPLKPIEKLAIGLGKKEHKAECGQ